MKISIITVVLNGEKYIRETLESVKLQDYHNIEYLVIDGLSTDGTIQIIKEYMDVVSYFESKKDDSMYDAINYAISLSTGDYVMILNSDDKFIKPSSLSEFCNYVSDMDYDAYYSNLMIYRNKKIVKRFLFDVNYIQLRSSRHCTFVPHTSLLVKRNVCLKLSYYNLKYLYVSDYDFILRLMLNGFSLKHIPLFLTIFREHDESHTMTGRVNQERILLLNDFKINPMVEKFNYVYIWVYYKLINLLKKF
jgi:glycosyltransferase involved in cell wall biosynthesis